MHGVSFLHSNELDCCHFVSQLSIKQGEHMNWEIAAYGTGLSNSAGNTFCQFWVLNLFYLYISVLNREENSSFIQNSKPCFPVGIRLYSWNCVPRAVNQWLWNEASSERPNTTMVNSVLGNGVALHLKVWHVTYDFVNTHDKGHRKRAMMNLLST